MNKLCRVGLVDGGSVLTSLVAFGSWVLVVFTFNGFQGASDVSVDLVEMMNASHDLRLSHTVCAHVDAQVTMSRLNFLRLLVPAQRCI